MKTMNTQRRRPRSGGFSAMFSMVFLTLFSTLAVGFYAATNTTVQVSTNDQRASLAQTAAECGMDVMRYQLAQVKIPPGTPSNMVMSSLYTQLCTNMNGTRNMGSETVGMVNNVIYIPANTSHKLTLDPSDLSSYAITVTSWGSDIVVKATGNDGSVSAAKRSITLD